MKQPIRGSVLTATDFDEPETMTLRDAVEWTKRVVQSVPDVLTQSERGWVDERFKILAEAIAGREGVPVGYVMYLVHELATTEMAMLETAQREALEGGS